MIKIDWTKRETAKTRAAMAAEEAREAERAKARRFLAETDWYVTRSIDPSDGRPIPDHVLAARAAARETASKGTSDA